MRFGGLTRGTRRVMALFLAVTIAPAAALGWLGWEFFELDREAEDYRVRGRIEVNADRVADALRRHLDEAVERLADVGASQSALPDVPGGAVIITFDAGRVKAHPPGRLIYLPVPPAPLPSIPAGTFAEGTALELRPDHAGAIAAYRELLPAADPAVRAGALLRLARVYRTSGQHGKALGAYREMERLGPVLIEDGTPADLFARQARCVVLAHLGLSVDLEREARALGADIESGRWLLDRASYGLYLEELRRLVPPALQPRHPAPEALALAAGVGWIWAERQRAMPDSPGESGWRSLWVESRPVLVLWRATGHALTLLAAAGPDYIAAQWGQTWIDAGMTVALLDPEGHAVLGDARSVGLRPVIRRATDTGLPWTIHMASANPAAESAEAVKRRRLLMAGLAMMALLTIFGGVFTARAAAREFAVARLQSDFVSAVSHEFRTPLTTLRHMTDLLANDVVLTDDRRRTYFAVMSSETERLQRLVEGLLEFGRMDTRDDASAFEVIDPVEMTETAVADFRSCPESGAHRVELTTGGMAPKSAAIRANREALSRAIRNLLENAVKYSPGAPCVQVGLARQGHQVAIEVHDEGFGIPADEQKTIFGKFVRGTASKALNVPGTGIGLALTHHIVRAHGGEVLLDSAPGRGTTFTIRLPLCEGAAT